MDWKRKAAPGETSPRLNCVQVNGIELLVYADQYKKGGWLMTLKQERLVFLRGHSLSQSTLDGAKEEAVGVAVTFMEGLGADVRGLLGVLKDGK